MTFLAQAPGNCLRFRRPRPYLRWQLSETTKHLVCGCIIPMHSESLNEELIWFIQDRVTIPNNNKAPCSVIYGAFRAAAIAGKHPIRCNLP